MGIIVLQPLGNEMPLMVVSFTHSWETLQNQCNLSLDTVAILLFIIIYLGAGGYILSVS